MRDFKKYSVWKDSHSFVLDIYMETKKFPKEELYGLISQIRRAASSISTNIAEGCGKKSDKDFARFLDISFGSASETEYLLILCNDLNYLNSEKFEELTEKIISIKKQLFQLIKKIND